MHAAEPRAKKDPLPAPTRKGTKYKRQATSGQRVGGTRERGQGRDVGHVKHVRHVGDALPGSFADITSPKGAEHEETGGPAGGQDAAASAGAPAPSGLPCLNSNNSTGTLSGGHRRTAYALEENVKALADRFGIERLGLLTLTFRDHVTCIKEAQRRYNSLQTHEIRSRYAASIAVVERQKSGRLHFHLLVVLAQDIRTGFDFAAIDAQDYRSANDFLRAEWSFWRRTASKYGFGRTELLPIRSTVDAISKYVGKYIAKHLEARDPRDKGARLVRYTADARQVGTRFAWVGAKPTLWRVKVAAVAQDFGFRDTDGFKREFGPRWAYHLGEYIASRQLTEWPSERVKRADLEMREAAASASVDHVPYVDHVLDVAHVTAPRE